MSTVNPGSTVSERRARPESPAMAWRAAAVAATLLLGTAAVTAFRRERGGPLEAESLTLRGAQGATVTLSVTPNGDLQARFGGQQRLFKKGPTLVIVDESGRTVARLGAPAAQNVAP